VSRVPATAPAIEQAAAQLAAGKLVAFPTETVYGLGADATNPRAVARVFEAKGRPSFDPIIVHVASAAQARALWTSCPPAAESLMRAFWPGPLSIVLPKTSAIPDLVTAGLPMVAVRLPDHPVAQQLIRAAGRPVAAPSANRFGGVSPTTAQAVEEELGGVVDCILDGGPTRVGIESAVVAFDSDRPVLLRPGGVPLEALERLIGPVALGARGAGPSASPGMLERHYATRTPLYLLRSAAPDGGPGGMPAMARRIGTLSLGAMSLPAPTAAAEVLSASGDLVEAAAGLFEAMRRLDRQSLDLILATPVPARGLGRAINDRLERASQGEAWWEEGRLVLGPRRGV
jgi:L-threonylcarbamoyladenylate synthase